MEETKEQYCQPKVRLLALHQLTSMGFNYRERGYKASECTKEKFQTTDRREQPNNGVANRNVHPHGQGQLFAVQPPETEITTLGGTFFILGEPISILFDTGATYYFIYAKLVLMVNLLVKGCDFPLCVATPTSSMVELSNKVDACPIMIGNVEHLAGLYVLEMVPYDVILGMDWLSSNFVQLDSVDKTITFAKPGQSKVVVQTTSRSLFVEAFLSHIEGEVVDSESLHIASIPVVSDFADLFQEVPGLPLSREVEFCIELQPGTIPIARAPYRMAPKEMQELKSQIDQLLSQGFIRRISSPWGSPVLFVKKKDGSLRLCVDYLN
ncbi:uncharacterized protein LOC113294203 [Papaver somniferum]|uniref:uncharacterized protein LOC113294203 n=1 Tax=Papaver somniferum TaxID=3469 RepID=UPI000E6FEB6B|nr:uncharacterized protein LOC113294203 [Papaver somniferum]